MKEAIHSDLLSLSIEQEPAGRLPKGLIQEIEEAKELGQKLFSKISLTKIFSIEQNIRDDKNYWPSDIVSLFTQEKIYSRWLPGFVGGVGGHPLALYGLNFVMGSKCLGLANLVGSHYVGLGLVSMTGSFNVLKKIADDILQAEDENKHCLVSVAITEPGAGSDMEEAELLKRAKVNTKAVKVAGGYRITGQKIFISNSAFSQWYIGSAFTDLHHPDQSLVIFAVRSNAEGIQLGRSEKKLGQLASTTNVLFFDNVFIPDEDICFSPDEFKDPEQRHLHSKFLLSDLISLSRAGVGVLATGAQLRILEILQERENNFREQWAQSQVAKILQNFIVSKMVSWSGQMECYSRGPLRDMHSPLTYGLMKSTPKILGNTILKSLSRNTFYKKRRELSSVSSEKYVFGMGALVKSFCSDKAMESVSMAIDLIGNDGSMAARELEKLSRDLKLLQIYEGANELNELMIYKNFIGPKDDEITIFKE